jgi:hypothetical protein
MGRLLLIIVSEFPLGLPIGGEFMLTVSEPTNTFDE